jgi:hypothetical protein
MIRRAEDAWRTPLDARRKPPVIVVVIPSAPENRDKLRLMLQLIGVRVEPYTRLQLSPFCFISEDPTAHTRIGPHDWAHRWPPV